MTITINPKSQISNEKASRTNTAAQFKDILAWLWCLRLKNRAAEVVISLDKYMIKTLSLCDTFSLRHGYLQINANENTPKVIDAQTPSFYKQRRNQS